MSETKIQLNERKIRKGIRKQKEADKAKMWKKLSAVHPTRLKIELTVVKTRVTAESHVAKSTMSWDVSAIRGATYNKVIINEWAE